MIAVITRTSNRPKFFKKCKDSVIVQGSICKHYVISDNLNDLSYLNDMNVHNVNKKILEQNYKEAVPSSAKPPIKSIHNLYFNEIYNNIKEPWVYHLDDDNELLPGAFNKVFKKINSNTDLVIFRINHFTGKLPRDNDFRNKIIRVGGIDTGCFLVKTSLMKTVKWDGWKCGDYRVIDKLVKITKNVQWIDDVVMKMPQQNLGNRTDLV
jgi:hypothetical protein